MNRRDCFANPPRKNEDYNMELSEIREWPDNSWAFGCPEARKAYLDDN